MIRRLQFWKNWLPAEQQALLIPGLASLASFLTAICAFIFYPWPSIKWEKTIQDQQIESPAHRLSIGPYGLEIKSDSYAIWESYAGSSLDVSAGPYLLFGVFVILGLSVLFALHSTLKRFYFFAGTGFLLFTIAGMRFEVLLPNWPAYSITALVFLLWLMPGLLFQYKFPTTTFHRRLIFYASLLSITLLAFGLITSIEKPLVYFSVGLIPVTLIIITIYVILIVHEIPAALIRVIGQAGQDRNGFRDFLILISIYLINLFAVYLSDLKWFEWTYGVHPILLILISGCLSIWGIRFQQKQLEGFLDAEPFGVYLMVALGVISSAGIGLFYLTGNDALFSTFRDLSLYAHIGYGFVFVTYVVSNFASLLVKGINISKVLYQPTVMPFFTYRFGGLVATLAFIFYNTWQRPINDSIGGYYNALSAYHRLAGDKNLSTGYLKVGSRYAFHNHQSNIQLAELSLAEGNADQAKKYFQNAIERRPTEQTFLNLVNLLEINGKSLESFTYLKEGLKKFPNSPYLLNALGLTNYGLGSSDSSIWYFNESEKQGTGLFKWTKRESSTINRLALQSKERQHLNVDSLLNKVNSENLAIQANILALANQLNRSISIKFIPPKDSLFTDDYAAWLNNWLINQRSKLNEETLQTLRPYLDHLGNQVFAESLNYSFAIAAYESGYLNLAFNQMEKAIFIGEEKGKYNNILAVWMLDQGNAEVAIQYSDFAIRQEFQDAALTRAVILAEAGRLGESIIAWDTLGNQNNGTIKFLSDLSKRALGINVSFFNDLTEEEEYTFIRYRVALNDSGMFKKLKDKISNSDLKARVIYDRTYRLLESDRLTDAIRLYQQLDGIPISNEQLYHQIQLLELRMLAAQGELSLLKARMNNSFQFKPAEQSYRMYFEGILALPDTSKAGIAFRWIERNNLLCTDGILAAAKFKADQKNDLLAAYSLLANAVHRNPYSIRLLKSYIRTASALGLTDYVSESISELKSRLDVEEFRQFILSLPPPTNLP